MKNLISILGLLIALLTLILSFYQAINDEEENKITYGDNSPIVTTKNGKVELNY